VARVRLRPQERRALIVQAATEVFARRGYREASMAEVAGAAGITPAVIYDHFPSKADLQIELLEDVNERLLAQVGAALAEAPEEPAERMRRGVDAFFRFFEDHPDTWRLLFRDPPSDPRILEVYEGIHQNATSGIAELLKANAPAELFADPSAELRLEMLAQLLKTAQNGLADWWYDRREVPRERVVEAVLDFCWLGLERVAQGDRSG
jgi:AcrR family transcriptional regulator